MPIEIKGSTIPALLIKLDKNLSLEENIQEIKQKLSSTFFKGSLAVIDFNGLKITDEEREKIDKILQEYNTKLLGLIGIEKTEKKDLIQNITPKKSLKIINKTLRSGQKVEEDSDVVILGDVNQDAYVIASGSIIVMGTLRGIVHAGANGDETAVVMALKLKPQQLRIASYISRSPDNKDEEPEYPEKAYIEEDKIVIEKI